MNFNMAVFEQADLTGRDTSTGIVKKYAAIVNHEHPVRRRTNRSIRYGSS